MRACVGVGVYARACDQMADAINWQKELLVHLLTVQKMWKADQAPFLRAFNYAGETNYMWEFVRDRVNALRDELSSADVVAAETESDSIVGQGMEADDLEVWMQETVKGLRWQRGPALYEDMLFPTPTDDALGVNERSEQCTFDDAATAERVAVDRHVSSTVRTDDRPLVAQDDKVTCFDQRDAWKAFRDEALKNAGEGAYFARSTRWSIKRVEDLQTDYLNERADEALDGEPLGPDDVWRETSRARLRSRQLEIDRLGAIPKEVARRLVLVHVAALDQIQAAAPGGVERESVTGGYHLDSLVQNVAHLLKYRRCVKLAKLLYKRQGVGSLHDQYEGKLLNKELAHAHQDESDSEMGIARRIIRQAHVSNYTHYSYTDASKRDAPVIEGNRLKYYPEEYNTNPPMAPIMCSAPPRMGKSALTMLVASFAVKLGGRVEYGVAPNKGIPVDDTLQRIDRLGWAVQGLVPHSTNSKTKEQPTIGDINVYSEDEVVSDIPIMNHRVHDLSNKVDAWVLHIRDEAQYVYKVSANINTALADSFPLFYGLSMCVSATLLPVCMEGELLGNLNSVRSLLEVKCGKDEVRRSTLEKYVILQPWSFPKGPDFLTPPKSHYFGGTPEAYLNEDWYDERDGWYQDIYDPPSPGTVARETQYYGTWLHVREHREVDEAGGNAKRFLTSEQDVFLDDCLAGVRMAHAKLLRLNVPGTKAVYNLNDAYSTYLRAFNQHNRKYFDEQTGTIAHDGPLRIVTPPVNRLTMDAAWILEQSLKWLRESSAVQPDTNADVRLYPMLITAPDLLQARRMEWVSVLFKLAWYRMHKEYMEYPTVRTKTSDEIRNTYGMTILMYQADTSAYANIAAAADIDDESLKRAKVVAVTFDPTLAENRFPMHAFPEAQLPRGTMESSVFIPTITPSHYRNYHALYMELRRKIDKGEDLSGFGDHFKSLNALHFLMHGHPEFDVPIEGSNLEQHFNALQRIVHRVYRFDMSRCWERSKNPNQLSDEQVGDADLNPDGTGVLIHNTVSAGEQEVFDGDMGCPDRPGRLDLNPDEPYDEHPGDQGPTEAGGGASQDSNQAADMELDQALEAELEDDSKEPHPIPPCRDPEIEGTDGPSGPRERIPDLSAIAPRLCVKGYRNAQEAIKDTLLQCKIHKVAAAGYKMFEAGLTLQTTHRDGDLRHMFVPKYINFALGQPPKMVNKEHVLTKEEREAERKKGRGGEWQKKAGLVPNQLRPMWPNLSTLYQMLGRGFVDTKDVKLPKDWRLDMLSRPEVLKCTKLYGNCELLFGLFVDESIEGRKLALGSLLHSIADNPYKEIMGKWLGKKDGNKYKSQALMQASTLRRQLSLDLQNDARMGKWPFYRMRDCVDGHLKPATPADLTDEEKAMEGECPALEDGSLALKRFERPQAEFSQGIAFG